MLSNTNKNKICEKIGLKVPDIINLSSKIISVLSNNNRVEWIFIKITADDTNVIKLSNLFRSLDTINSS